MMKEKLIIGMFGPHDAVDRSDLERVLVIKFRNFGDTLLMTPVFTVLRSWLAQSVKIDVLIYEDCKSIIKDNAAVDNVFCVQRGSLGISAVMNDMKQWAQLRSHQYDLVLNLTEGDRGALVSLFSGAKYRVGLEHKSNIDKWWKRIAYTHWYRTDSKKRHAVEQNLDALRRLGLQIDDQDKPLVLAVNKIDQRSAVNKLEVEGWSGGSYIVLHPTSRWLFKCITPEQSIGLMRGLKDCGLDIVLTAGPDDRERVMLDQIIAGFCGAVIDLGSKISLGELAAVIGGARFIVGPDSLPIHIAAALNVPSLVWFGPSDENIWRPWMTRHRVIAKKYSCRPCGLDGCGGGKNSECLTDISDRELYEEIQKMYNEDYK